MGRKTKNISFDIRQLVIYIERHNVGKHIISIPNKGRPKLLDTRDREKLFVK